ncbi:sensor histidine kinase [Trichlorobacter lovleyi]|uniref:histidine kinase n=1 Tax=Trichlorobacter lovleyi (strain ATCC BAA-1151 / DSM 17278 / SZ) TaxID=398767 RepID=B3E349_TRIL1|nr:ATP-binding protein [Trichlorobacter lovleyi]ACD94261.1 integral membrane sensor signal transduction histidine kinase [Trichlorobacter lovleyi SZ]
MVARPLRHMLVRFAALITLLPLGLTALLGSLWLLPEAEQEIASYHRQLALTIAGQVDSYFKASRVSAVSVAAVTGQTDLAVVQKAIATNLQLLKRLRAMYLVDATGRVRAVGVSNMSKALQGDLLGLDLSRNELFQKARASGTEQWSDSFLSVVGGGLSVAVAMPAGSNVVIEEFDLAHLSEFLHQTTPGSEQLIMLIDRHGQVVADQAGTWTAQQLNLNNIPLIHERLTSTKEVRGSLVLNGIEMVGSLHKINTVDWWILVARPRHAAYRQLWTSLGIMAVTLAATTLAAFGVAMVLTRRMSQRFESLAEHAQLVTRGGEATDWPHSTIVEFNALADSLQQMSESLHERARLLEDEIAERQHAQEELHEKALLLEQEIGERVLAEHNLQVKQTQLEALNLTLEARVLEELAKNREKDALMIQQGRLAAMGEMLSNIAHQWRQPLNELGIMIQTLRLEYDDKLLDGSRIDEFSDDCMRTILHMSKTIDTFRDFFKKDRSLQQFDPSVCIVATVELLKASLQAAGISLRLDLQPECLLQGQPNDFSQVILNILNNARDILLARAVATPVITVTSQQAQGVLVIVVEDNGGGIAADIVDKVFDPYFTTKHKAQGTGLGLYISKKIIEGNFNGTITVEHCPGGTRFRIAVPVRIAETVHGESD